MELNQVYSGFKLIKKDIIAESASETFEFVHLKSGARLFYLKRDDDNKVFSISFRTTPCDDKGIPHIVEHSTLCGSRKFPTKEPFVELAKGSLNTFLNAMTFPDKTMYPIASCNDKDFRNLMDVYLDAVFYPAIYTEKDILRQEGWHYELESKDAPLEYSGVVYNEMKGALSSPEDLLEIETMKALFPDNTYRFESGGNPEAIPELTQEQFEGFHKKYYHPSNSYIFFYGKLDIEEQLEFLNDEYLSAFDKIEVDSFIPSQTVFSEMKRIVGRYPIGKEESPEEKTFLSYSFVVNGENDNVDRLGLAVLVQALLSSEASPFRKAVIDAKLGKDFTASCEDAVLQPYISLTALNGSETDGDRFLNVIMETAKDLVDNGIDKELLEAALNILEFKTREADFNQYPKGIIYSIGVMNSWLYDRDPAEYLHFEAAFKELREKINKGYFENLLKKLMLDNQHSVLITFAPDTEMGEKNEAKLRAELESIKAKMTDSQLEEVMEIDAKLKARQAAADTPEALATIPLLNISDIDPKAKERPLEILSDSMAEYLWTDVPTNGITYLTFYFDAAVIPQADVHYANLLMDILGSIDTISHKYTDLINLTDLNTGGIYYNLSAVGKHNDIEKYTPFFTVSVKSLSSKLPEAVGLVQEIVTGSCFDNQQRLRDLLAEIKSSAELSILRSPHVVMSARLQSYLLPAAAYNDQKGLDYYGFVSKLLDDFESMFEVIKEKLSAVSKQLFNRHNLKIGVVAPAKEQTTVKNAVEGLLKELDNTSLPAQKYVFDLTPRNEGLMISSQVQYAGKAANFRKLGKGYNFSGALLLLETIMRYDYLWLKIRVQGGAYGAFANIGRSGTVMFASYRDPNLAATYNTFDGIAEYLRTFEVSEREITKYIIGTMSGIDAPKTPKNIGQAARACYFQGITLTDRQKAREEVLSATLKDIRDTAEMIDECMKQNILCAIGNENTLKENAELFKSLKSVII
ncbi:MAG: insulinase family protein [Selenomonadaceae bacterium]|nr:insulinase family protein [Selenomonadaceae bacterium]